jgi:hypothetical protein
LAANISSYLTDHASNLFSFFSYMLDRFIIIT